MPEFTSSSTQGVSRAAPSNPPAPRRHLFLWHIPLFTSPKNERASGQSIIQDSVCKKEQTLRHPRQCSFTKGTASLSIAGELLTQSTAIAIGPEEQSPCQSAVIQMNNCSLARQAVRDDVLSSTSKAKMVWPFLAHGSLATVVHATTFLNPG